MLSAKNVKLTPFKSFLLSTLPIAAFSSSALLLNHWPVKSSEKLSRMRNLLSDAAASRLEEKWENLWKEGVTPWDLGGPTLLLQNELKMKASQEQWNLESGTFRSLVPGCGSAYDLHTIRSFHESLLKKKPGIESVVVGLDISSTSLERSHQALSQLLSTSKDSDQETIIELYHGDFFTNMSEWALRSSFEKPPASHAAGTDHDPFDFIFDYTFFCALSPELRSQWAIRMAELLKPTGKILTLIFPIFPKDSPEMLAMEGPPYPVSVDAYKNVLEPLGFQIMEGSPYESELTVSRRQGKEMVCWWHKTKAQR